MILNDIDDLCNLIKMKGDEIGNFGIPHNAVLLGVLERQKMLKALRHVLNLAIESFHLESGQSIYKGLRIIPVDLPSFMAMAYVGEIVISADLRQVLS